MKVEDLNLEEFESSHTNRGDVEDHVRTVWSL
jgi:hypothetical protein